MEDHSLHLDTSTTGSHNLQVQVHPVVIFSILDHFIRRNDESEKLVIGTLLGSNNDGIVEIKNCFPVPHMYNEDEQVGVDMAFHRNMLELNTRANPKETIVGWYATGGEINEVSAIIQDFYWKEMNRAPIHLTVDTNLTNYKLSIKAFTNTSITFGEKALGSQFLPVSCEVQSFDSSEKLGVDVLVKAKNNPNLVLSDLENLESSVEKLIGLIETIYDYVNKVLEGKISANNKVGRFLTDAVAALPKLDPASVEKLFNSNLQDLLMVVYLSNLTRTQLSLAEKLSKVV